MFNYTPEDPEIAENALDDLDYPLVSGDTEAELGRFPALYAEEYDVFKRGLLAWLLQVGKKPRQAEGYSQTTVRSTHYKLEQVFRWLWEATGEYATDLQPEQARQLLENLYEHPDYTDQQVLDYEKAIKRLYRYYAHAQGRTYELEHDLDLDQDTFDRSMDYFKQHELSQLYQATLEISSVKSYGNKSMTSEERDRIKIYLAQRFEKPKHEIGPEDFRRANSWKFPSLMAACLDTGLRPIEIKKSNIRWFNLEDHELVIPKEEAAKEPADWECALSEKTVEIVKKWLAERATYDDYAGRDEVWLTRRNNPYTSNSLNKLLQNRILPRTSIEARGRDLSWYAIRRGVATMWANQEGLHDAKEQLRHKKIETTMKYVHSGAARRAQQANSKW